MWSKDFEKEAKEHQKKYLHLLKKGNKSKLIQQLPVLHKEAFQKIDCLTCANCCKNYSPRFKMPDIKRISKHLKMKEGDFIATYLHLDKEEDYVLQSQPCPFLDHANYCSIYNVRPRDCARYPYTDEDVLIKQPSLTVKNATICPAVHFVLEKMLDVNKT
jgi:Fe-S-cluster containining protein